MKFCDMIKMIIETDGSVPVTVPQVQTSTPEQPAVVAKALPPEPEKILTSGYEKAKQITIDCLTILKNCIDLGLNMEGVINPELEETIKTIEIPEAVSNDKIAETITLIHDGMTERIEDESPKEN